VLGAQVSSLHWDGRAWVVTLATASGASDLRAAGVVLAVPAYAAAHLLAPVDGEAAELLSSIEYAPIVTLPLGVEAAKLRHPAEGFGFLVPRAANMSILGCLFMSRLFPGRAPKGHELLQCMVGGVRWPRAADEPDDRLLEYARQDVDRLLGLGGEPEDLGLTRWPRAIPQPGREHVSRMRRLRERLASLGGLTVAGGYLDGVGVPDSFASGLRAARDLTVS
jgi:oxygen-dependent protoporphyrinogen oxidase